MRKTVEAFARTIVGSGFFDLPAYIRKYILVSRFFKSRPLADNEVLPHHPDQSVAKSQTESNFLANSGCRTNCRRSFDLAFPFTLSLHSSDRWEYSAVLSSYAFQTENNITYTHPHIDYTILYNKIYITRKNFVSTICIHTSYHWLIHPCVNLRARFPRHPL